MSLRGTNAHAAAITGPRDCVQEGRFPKGPSTFRFPTSPWVRGDVGCHAATKVAQSLR